MLVKIVLLLYSCLKLIKFSFICFVVFLGFIFFVKSCLTKLVILVRRVGRCNAVWIVCECVFIVVVVDGWIIVNCESELDLDNMCFVVVRIKSVFLLLLALVTTTMDIFFILFVLLFWVYLSEVIDEWLMGNWYIGVILFLFNI